MSMIQGLSCHDIQTSIQDLLWSSTSVYVFAALLLQPCERTYLLYVMYGSTQQTNILSAKI